MQKQAKKVKKGELICHPTMAKTWLTVIANKKEQADDAVVASRVITGEDNGGNPHRLVCAENELLETRID